MIQTVAIVEELSSQSITAILLSKRSQPYIYQSCRLVYYGEKADFGHKAIWLNLMLESSDTVADSADEARAIDAKIKQENHALCYVGSVLEDDERPCAYGGL